MGPDDGGRIGNIPRALKGGYHGDTEIVRRAHFLQKRQIALASLPEHKIVTGHHMGGASALNEQVGDEFFCRHIGQRCVELQEIEDIDAKCREMAGFGRCRG